MKHLQLIVASLIVAFLSAAVFAQTPFAEAVAGTWKGTLEYKDYTSNGRVTMPVLIRMEPSGPQSVVVTTFYDDFGNVYRDRETWSLDGAGNIKFGDSSFRVEESAPGRIVAIGSGQDGDTIEPTRKTLTWDAKTFSLLKETRSPWSFRNVYNLRRSEEYSAPPVVLTPEKMRADLAALRTTLAAIHPGLYRYQTPAEFDGAFAALDAELAEPMREGRFFGLVATLLSKLGCGHTYQNPYNQNDVGARLFGGRTVVPFYFRIVDGRIFVTESAASKKLAPGTEITSINGVKVGDIIARLTTAVRSDGRSTSAHRVAQLELRRAEAERFAAFDYLFPIFFPFDEPVFKFEAVAPGTGKAFKFESIALTKAERSAEMAVRYGPADDYDTALRFDIRDDGRVGVLTIPHSIAWRLKTRTIEKFYADAFAEMRAKNVPTLVVDLRGNGGGSMDVGYELARYLAKKPLPPYAKGLRLVRNVAAQPEIAKLVDTYSDELLKGLREGVPAKDWKKYRDGYFEILGRENYPAVAPYENAFRGQAFIITDAAAASATYQLLDYFKANKLATIVGQPGGGNLQGINGGNFFFFRMPNSRIEVDIPAYFQTTGKKRPDSPVIPDVIVKRTPGSVEDEEMAAVKGLIGKK